MSSRGIVSGPAGIWILSSSRNDSYVSLNRVNNVINAKCSEDCVVLGVYKENFTLV
jgi:hypothetical protein